MYKFGDTLALLSLPRQSRPCKKNSKSINFWLSFHFHCQVKGTERRRRKVNLVFLVVWGQISICEWSETETYDTTIWVGALPALTSSWKSGDIQNSAGQRGKGFISYLELLWPENTRFCRHETLFEVLHVCSSAERWTGVLLRIALRLVSCCRAKPCRARSRSTILLQSWQPATICNPCDKKDKTTKRKKKRKEIDCKA